MIENKPESSQKKFALYARTSTADQQTGLESQVRVLRTYCEQNKITNVEFYTDGGISGTKASRPALDRMTSAKAAVNSDAGTGDIWFKGKGAFQKCLQSPGVNSAMMQEKFWKKNEKAGESSSSTTR